MKNALYSHPDRHHLIFPVGSTVVIEEIETKLQEFLAGHTNTINCIDVSRCGKYLASGQVTYQGFKVRVTYQGLRSRSHGAQLAFQL